MSSIKADEDLYKILEDIVKTSNDINCTHDQYGNEFVTFAKDYSENVGIKVCGSFVNEKDFHMDYYFPYLKSVGISSVEPIEIERHAGKQAYSGICDEVRLGVALIFFIKNVTDAMTDYDELDVRKVFGVTLSALSPGGKVLLPIKKAERAEGETLSDSRTKLIREARGGDEKAIEILTMKEMDTMGMIQKRIQHEDILSIVDTSFIPYGIESDQYAIIGEIVKCQKQRISLTGEDIWILSILCNDMNFDVSINARDLFGEPQVGRRFKGTIWLQGELNYI